MNIYKEKLIYASLSSPWLALCVREGNFRVFLKKC